MMTRYYQFAGLRVAISMPEDLFYEKEFKLAPFRREYLEADWTFQFMKTEQLLPPAGVLVSEDSAGQIYADSKQIVRYIDAYGGNWGYASARVEYRDKQAFVQLRSERFPNRAIAKYVLICLGIEHMVAQNHGFVFHCSFIEHEGKAVLFTAPSGTGKSTQAELWKEYRGAGIINGDRAVIRLTDGVLMAEGLPFSGSSENCENISLPISAIVYLAQAPETSIRKVRGYEAFSKIWEGVSVNTWDKEDMELVSAVVQKVAERIPVYHMPCTPDESAVIALETELRKQVKA